MVQVLLQTCPQACVIFCATQQRVREVTQFLRAKGVSVAGIHAGLDQAERFSVLMLLNKVKFACWWQPMFWLVA